MKKSGFHVFQSESQARVSGVQTDIARLESVLADLRTQISVTGEGESNSLADLTRDVRMAEIELTTRQGMLQQSLQNLENARIEADRQVRYLSVNVRPIAPDEPTYPRVSRTHPDFLILLGISLMISVTASILREQVSA